MPSTSAAAALPAQPFFEAALGGAGASYCQGYANCTAAVASIDPRGGATSGPYIDKLFDRLGIAAEVRAMGVLCKTGRDVARAVASGRATLGLTQAAELIGVEGLAFAGFLPDALQLVTVYAAAVAADSKLPQAAAAFIAFVTGPQGAERLRQSGWDAGP